MTNRGLFIVGLTCLLGGVGAAGLAQTNAPKPPTAPAPAAAPAPNTAPAQAAPLSPAPAGPAKRAQYRIDAKKSRFLVETQTSGLSAMFAHDHRIEISDYTGTVTFAPGGGALDLTVRAASLRLSEEKSLGERQAIESALREDVLETTKYPEISFKSRKVTTERRGDGTYDARLTGELKLHGVRKQVTIPARVSLQNDTLRAIGVFEIRQTDYKITPFSFVSGSVTIKDQVTISFDLVATK